MAEGVQQRACALCGDLIEDGELAVTLTHCQPAHAICYRREIEPDDGSAERGVSLWQVRYSPG